MSNIKQRIRFLEADAKHHDVKSSSIMMVSTRTVLSIVEAFRELEQRAEAAEYKLAEKEKASGFWGRFAAKETIRANKAEAQLADRAKQEPDYFLNRIECSDPWLPEAELRIYESQLDASKSRDDHGGGIIELYTRPAPAAVTVDLVPDEATTGSEIAAMGWNACRAEMLRRIEGLK